MPFGRLKVRLKREIVTMKVPGLDPAREAGPHVAPADWNALVDDPGTVVIDTRNDFEVGYGSFAGAVNRSEEHTSELQSLMRMSYAGFCVQKKKTTARTYNSAAVI